jgi:hypothetical protein
MTSQAAVTHVRKLIAEKTPLGEVCEKVMDHCLAPSSEMTAGVGCDNMTIVVVGILNGKTLDEWYEFIAKRYAENPGPTDDTKRPNGNEDLDLTEEEIARKEYLNSARFDSPLFKLNSSSSSSDKSSDSKKDKEDDSSK